MSTTLAKSVVARNLASVAERNLLNLCLQASREMKRARSEEEIAEIADVGCMLAKARQLVVPFVIEGAK